MAVTRTKYYSRSSSRACVRYDKITDITQQWLPKPTANSEAQLSGREIMQWFVFLWFQLQMTKQYLQEKTSGPVQSPAHSGSLNTPVDTGASRTHPSSKHHRLGRR